MSEKGWKDKKLFGWLDAKTGEAEEVSWRDLSWREKNSLLKSLVLVGYILPTSLIGFGSASKRLLDHWQNQRNLTISTSAEENGENIIVKHEDGRPIVYLKESKGTKVGIVRKIILPPNVINLIKDSDEHAKKESQPVSSGWEPTVHRSPSSVSESPVYRAKEEKKKRSK